MLGNKKLSHTVTVHHFDDEPELMEWFPEVLMLSYWNDSLPGWFPTEEYTEEYADTKRFIATFRLKKPNFYGHITVKYKTYAKGQDLLESREAFEPQDVFLLDMNELVDGRLKATGLELHKKIHGKGVPDDNIIFLTGYPGHLEGLDREDLEKKNRLFVKPPSIDSLVAKVASLINSYLPE